MTRPQVVFLFDVDNTLLDNDRVTEDLKRHLEETTGHARQEDYWAIFERVRGELGYADYLGALQRDRVEHPRDSHVLTVSRFLLNYPSAKRVFPLALDVESKSSNGARRSSCLMETWCSSRGRSNGPVSSRSWRVTC